jgi:tryptophan synthase alpha chain
MNRLHKTFASLRAKHQKALSLYVTAGFPKLGDTLPLVLSLAEHGADLIELGVAFSDPIADGPTIQASSEAALRNGITLEKTYEIARQIRAQSEIPLVLMGYSNPIFHYGMDRFFARCAEIGIDGTIIPDLSLEEGEEYRAVSQRHGISSIFLVAPTSSDERIRRLDEASDGFLYCVSVTGVTGERKGLGADVIEFLERARRTVRKNPLLVGFGISTPEDASLIARNCDGIVIGSALVNILKNSQQNGSYNEAKSFVQQMRKAIDTSKRDSP